MLSVEYRLAPEHPFPTAIHDAREALAWAFEHAAGLGADHDPKHPSLSPLFVDDLSGVAEASIITAELDPLRDEGEAYANALRDAGSPVILRRFPGLIHGFINMTAINPASHDALVEMAGSLRAMLATVREEALT